MSEGKEAQVSLLTGVEKGFTERLGSKDKCLCCSPRAATIVICILLVLAVIYNLFVNTYMRWGKPCYIWWEHWATSVTFFVGLIARLCIFPVAVLTLVELQKGESGTKYLRVMFHGLLAFAVLLSLDVFLCLFEVNEVCNSKPMKDFELCAYECGLYDPAAPNGLRKNGTLVCPPECTMDGYDFTFMCDDSRDPQYRAHEDRQERIDSCQTMSMVSDVIQNGLFAMLMVSFAFALNSYRVSLEPPEDLDAARADDFANAKESNFE